MFELFKLRLKPDKWYVQCKWLYDRPNHWKCSNCGVVVGYAKHFYKYCYNCGARVVNDEQPVKHD